jgi:hypothetical protein
LPLGPGGPSQPSATATTATVLFAIYGIACLARRRFPMTDSCLTCLAIRDASATGLAHGVVTKTYSVIHLTVTEASRRYSPAAS